MTLESGNVRCRLSGIGPVERTAGHCRIALGVVVEVSVVIELFCRKQLGALQRLDLVVDLKEPPLDSLHEDASLRCTPRRDGEIGRRDGLKIRWAKARGGSSPPPGTSASRCDTG